MTATLQLLERWKTYRNITSDNAAAIELGIGRAAISRWRSAQRNADPELVNRMAHDLGENASAWVLAVEAEKHQAGNRATLLRLARQLGYAAIICLAVYTSFRPAVCEARLNYDDAKFYISTTDYTLRTVRVGCGRWCQFQNPATALNSWLHSSLSGAMKLPHLRPTT